MKTVRTQETTTNMRKIRVLVVDDSVVVRRLVSEVLTSDPAIELAGIAANGRIALAKLSQVNPDLVTLDIEMPEMDGLQALAELRKTHPRLPVIMFSTLTQRGAAASLDALALGANDYVTKPANVGSVTQGMQRVREELIPKIKALCPHLAGPGPAAGPGAGLDVGTKETPSEAMPFQIKTPLRTAPGSPFSQRIDVVVIGVSTGGPNALASLLPQFGADFRVPIVIVQHMPPMFTKLLADRLNQRAALQVQEGKMGESLQAGHIRIAPGDYHLLLNRHGLQVQLKLNQDPPENSCRPAVDALFRSATQVYGSHILAVVLTGMGHDGLHGCQAIREAGGQVIVQDEASSVVWGMPGFVAKAGLADAVLPLDRIGKEIQRRVKEGQPSPLRATG